MCLPAISFTEAPPVHQLELVGGRTHHRSNSVCVRSFYDALPNAGARVCACAVCVQCRAPHPHIRAHLFIPPPQHRRAQGGHRVCSTPSRPTLVAGDCGVGRVPSTVPEALPMCVRVRPMWVLHGSSGQSCFDARCICLRLQGGGGQVRAPAHRWPGRHWFVWPEFADGIRPALLEISSARARLLKKFTTILLSDLSRN